MPHRHLLRLHAWVAPHKAKAVGWLVGLLVGRAADLCHGHATRAVPRAFTGLSTRLLAAVLAGLLGAPPAQANPALDAGRELFTGAQPLVAQMPGQGQRLPANASRCINCHAAPGLRTAATGSFGPRLDTAHLIKPQARRGGPPSRYDAGSLCRALRDGVDPAGVVLSGAMPRYQIDDSACRQLWTLLTSEL